MKLDFVSSSSDNVLYNELPTKTRYYGASPEQQADGLDYTSYSRKVWLFNLLIILGMISVVGSVALCILAKVYLPQYEETGTGEIFKATNINSYILPDDNTVQCNFTAWYTFYVDDQEYKGIDVVWENNGKEVDANFDAKEYCHDLLLPLRDKAISGMNISVSYNVDDPHSDNHIYYDDSKLTQTWTFIQFGFGIAISFFCLASCLVNCWKRE